MRETALSSETVMMPCDAAQVNAWIEFPITSINKFRHFCFYKTEFAELQKKSEFERAEWVRRQGMARSV